MPRTSQMKKFLSACIGVLAVGCAITACPAARGQAKEKSGKDKTAKTAQVSSYQRVTDPAQYVGTETCKTCHEDMPSKGFFKGY